MKNGSAHKIFYRTVRPLNDRLHQRRLRFRPRRARLAMLGATDAPAGFRPTFNIRHRSLRFCRHRTTIKRIAYSRYAMFSPSVSGKPPTTASADF